MKFLIASKNDLIQEAAKWDQNTPFYAGTSGEECLFASEDPATLTFETKMLNVVTNEEVRMEDIELDNGEFIDNVYVEQYKTIAEFFLSPDVMDWFLGRPWDHGKLEDAIEEMNGVGLYDAALAYEELVGENQADAVDLQKRNAEYWRSR